MLIYIYMKSANKLYPFFKLYETNIGQKLIKFQLFILSNNGATYFSNIRI